MKGDRARTVAAAVSGLAAGAATIGTSELLATWLRVPSPLIAVSAWVVDSAPPALKDVAVAALGAADKPVLIGVVLGVLAAVFISVGIAALRRVVVGAVLATVVAGAGLVAVLTRPDPSGVPARLVPLVVAGAVGGLALFVLLRSLRSPRRSRASITRAEAVPATVGSVPVASDPPGFDRRGFALRTIAIVGAAVVTGGVSRVVATTGTTTQANIPPPDSPARPPGKETTVDVRGLPDFVTPDADFYRVDTALTVPRIDLATWQMRVHGLVRRELTIDFPDLLNRRLIERHITLTCVSNEVGGPYVSTGRWIGVPVKDILDEAGVAADADAVKSTSVDGMTIGTPLSALTDGRDALFALGMNGRPLSAERGFPVRLVVPGLYGYVSATKWLIDVEVTRFADFSAYWTERGWAERAPIKTASRIDVPRPFARLSPGRVAVAGVAWAQTRGIASVEVRVDGGDWQRARLAAEHSIDTWRQWVWRWDADPGSHRLEVRSTDRTGTPQTPRREPPRPDGSSGWHSVTVMVE